MSDAHAEAAANSASSPPKMMTQSQALPSTVYVPIDSIPRSHSIADGIAGWRPNPDTLVCF